MISNTWFTSVSLWVVNLVPSETVRKGLLSEPQGPLCVLWKKPRKNQTLWNKGLRICDLRTRRVTWDYAGFYLFFPLPLPGFRPYYFSCWWLETYSRSLFPFNSPKYILWMKSSFQSMVWNILLLAKNAIIIFIFALCLSSCLPGEAMQAQQLNSSSSVSVISSLGSLCISKTNY